MEFTFNFFASDGVIDDDRQRKPEILSPDSRDSSAQGIEELRRSCPDEISIPFQTVAINEELVLKVVSVSGCHHGSSKSDLIPGVYEGGGKVWEGSVDLARALVDIYPRL